jgi:hypothetical protein
MTDDIVSLLREHIAREASRRDSIRDDLYRIALLADGRDPAAQDWQDELRRWLLTPEALVAHVEGVVVTLRKQPSAPPAPAAPPAAQPAFITAAAPVSAAPSGASPTDDAWSTALADANRRARRDQNKLKEVEAYLAQAKREVAEAEKQREALWQALSKVAFDLQAALDDSEARKKLSASGLVMTDEMDAHLRARVTEIRTKALAALGGGEAKTEQAEAAKASL